MRDILMAIFEGLFIFDFIIYIEKNAPLSVELGIQHVANISSVLFIYVNIL